MVYTVNRGLNRQARPTLGVGPFLDMSDVSAILALDCGEC
jgi:hypothetical protein